MAIRGSYDRTTLVHGKGISSSGKHLRDNKYPAYAAWYNMIRRCYDPSNTMARYYAGCTVCEDWLNYQTFADWFVQQPSSKEPMEVDKDILGYSTIYSPETCLLIPSRVNKILINCNYASNSDLPVGVSNHKDRFRARCRDIDGTALSKVCATIAEAINWRNKTKQSVLRAAAELYKDSMSSKAYLALINYS